MEPDTYGVDKKSVERIEELEELIDLAETVSVRITKLEDMKSRANWMSAMVAAVVTSSCVVLDSFLLNLPEFNDKNGIDFVIMMNIFVGIGLFSFLLIQVRKANDYTKRKNEELRVLERLLNLTHEFKQSVLKDASIVKVALIEMRLSRISFIGSSKYLQSVWLDVAKSLTNDLLDTDR